MNSKYIKPFIHFFSANFIARFFSFIRELVIAWVIGPGKLLDIFFFLIALPEFINQIWNRPLETVLLKDYEEKNQKVTSNVLKKELTQKVLGLSFITVLILFVVVIGYPLIIINFYYGYINDISFWIVFFTNSIILVETLLLFLRTVSYSEQKFFLPTILPMIQSLIMIIGVLYFESNITLFLMTLLFSIGAFSQLFVYLKTDLKLFLTNLANRIKPVFNKLVLKDTMKLSLAAGLSSMNVLIDQAFALSLGEGANSYIHYGYFFLTIYSFLIVKNFNTILFPQFQKYVVQQRYLDLTRDIQKFTKVIILISLVATILLINNGFFALSKVLQYGKVSAQDMHIIFLCTLGYAGSFWGTAMNSMLVRVIHVYSEYRMLNVVAFLNFCINIFFNIVLIRLFGVWGIAISTSLSFIVIVIIYIVFLRKKRSIQFFADKKWYIKLIFAMVCLIIFEFMLVYFCGVNSFVDHSWSYNIIKFVLTVFIISLCFFGMNLIEVKKKRIYIS